MSVIQDGFEIPDEDWAKLISLASSLGHTGLEDDNCAIMFRLAICRGRMLSKNTIKPDQKWIERASRVVALCDELLADRGLLKVFFGGIKTPRSDLIRFFLDLERVRQRARESATPMKSPPPNVDLRRDGVWKELFELFETSTGRPARVSIGADGTKYARQGRGKIVEFIQAFMASVPGAPVPTADQVRAVERKSRPSRMVSGLLKNAVTADHLDDKPVSKAKRSNMKIRVRGDHESQTRSSRQGRR